MMQGLPEPQPGPDAMQVEDRAAPRFTLLIRTAKLVVEDRQYLCIVRDISATGARIRSFHPIPDGNRMAIEFQSGGYHAADLMWQSDSEAGFQFHTPIEVNDILLGYSEHPRRDLRFNVDLAVGLSSAGRQFAGYLVNLSRQGGSIHCADPLSIDQPVLLQSPCFPTIQARVRWRKGKAYGLIFDTTFSITNLAALICELHLPASPMRNLPEKTSQLAQPVTGV